MVYGIGNDLARAHRRLEERRLYDSSDDRRILGRLSGLSVRPLRRPRPLGRSADGCRTASICCTARMFRTWCRRFRSPNIWRRTSRQAIDCGVEAIHMEEPEFWAQSGYEEAFKREWLNYYGEDWIPPHSSPDAQYRASKLKAAMYYRALDRICSQMKEYALATLRPHGPVLCADAQPDQLYAVADRQPGSAARLDARVRRLHRADLDGNGADAERLQGGSPRAHLRDGVSRIRDHAGIDPGHGAGDVVPARSDRG